MRRSPGKASSRSAGARSQPSQHEVSPERPEITTGLLGPLKRISEGPTMSNTTKKKPPYVSKEILAWLNERFPNRLPSLTDSDREIWSKVGAADVLRHLQKLHDAQGEP